MKQLLLFAILFLPSLVSAQAIKQGTTSSAGDAGSNIPLCVASAASGTINTEGKYGYCSVDLSGNLRTTASFSFSGGTSDATKLEDDAHSSGARGDYVLGEIQATLSATAGDGDYGSFKLDPKGALWTRIAIDSDVIGAEDNAIPAGDYGFVILGQRQDTPTNDSNATGDAGYIKLDNLGKTWTAGDQTEDVAHASGDRGSAALFLRSDTLASTATTGDYENPKVDSASRVYTNPWGANHTEWFRACSASDVTGTTATEIQPATASKYTYLTAVNCTNTDATVSTRVNIVQETAVATEILWMLNLASVNGSDGMQFSPPLKATAVNKNIGVTPITTSAEVRCCVEGFVSAN